MFITDTQAKEWEFKDPVSGVDLKEVSEESYFFRLSRYHQQIRDFVATDGAVAPESRRQALLATHADGAVTLSL